MALLSRLLGKKDSAKEAAHAADLARSHAIAGRASGVSQEDQDATRARMEAEMAAQRKQREDRATTANA